MKKILLIVVSCIIGALMSINAAETYTLMKEVPKEGQSFIVYGSKKYSGQFRNGYGLCNLTSGYFSANIINSTSSEAVPETISDVDANALVVTLVTENAKNFLQIATEGANKGKFLKAGIANNTLSFVDATDEATAVTVTVATTGKADVEFQNTTKTYLQYNATSATAARVTNYKSKSTGVCYLYLAPTTDPGDTREDAGLKYETTSYNVALGDEFTAPELTNPNNLDVTYSSSNEAVATVAGDGAVAIVGVGTTTIKAAFAGNETYKEGSASYTLTVADAATTLAEFIEKGTANTSASIIMNCDLTVTYANGANIYVTDGTTYALIYKYNLGLSTGDVIAKGWEGKVTIYNGLPEIIPAAATLTTAGTAEVSYATVEAIGLENLTQVVVLKNVTFAAATKAETNVNFNGTVGDATYAFRNTFGIESTEAGTYDVLCVVSVFERQATTVVTDPANLQLLPIEYRLIPSFVDDKLTIAEMGITTDGMITAKYSFSIANYTDGEPVLTVKVLDADGQELPEDRVDIEVKPAVAPAEAPAKVAGTNKAFEGTIDALIDNPGALGTKYQLSMSAEYKGVTIVGESEKTPTAVEDIVVDNNAPAEYYNLQGVRVANPANGTYIRVAGGKATKVYVR